MSANMHPKGLPVRSFPICRYVSCSKNSLSDRIFWKKEIDHQYQFYLATLRAERDIKYLMKEHSDLLFRVERAETENVELRKEIRLLEMELFIMCQRNAHDSAVIDGLHEADYAAGEASHLESQMHRRLDMATVEGDHEDTLYRMVKEQIELLERKDEEDAELITSLKPLEDQLKRTLEEEKMKNHQKSAKFKRDLEELLTELCNRIREFERVVGEKSEALTWSDEMFRSTFAMKQVGQQQDVQDSETSSIESSQETDRSDVSAQLPMGDLGEGLEEMRETYRGCVAKKELLDLENATTVNVIHDCLQQFTEDMRVLADEYLSVFEISAEVDFVKEYLGRLDVTRRKKDNVGGTEASDVQTVQRIDQLDVIYNTLQCEKTFLDNSLHYFTSTLHQDFRAHCVTVLQSEELFSQPPADSE